MSNHFSDTFLFLCLSLSRRFVRTMRSAADLASICARRSSYRARVSLPQHSQVHFPPFLLQSLPEFAHDAASAGITEQGTSSPLSKVSHESAAAVKFEAGIQFNAWKLHVPVERPITGTQASFKSASPAHPAVTDSKTSSSSTSRPRTASSASCASVHGFIASDDGGSSAFSDSSDMELDAQSSVEGRRSPASARFIKRSVIVPHRPHTSSSHGSDSSSNVRSFRQFRVQTSSAQALSTTALLRALSSSLPIVNSLQVTLSLLRSKI